MKLLTLDDLSGLVAARERDIARRLGQRDRLLQDVERLRDKIASAQSESALEAQVQNVLNLAAALSWSQTKGRIEGIVQRALKAVFQDRDFVFRMDQETKRGVSTVTFLVSEDGVETELLSESGRGIADVVGFALRVAYLVLLRPATRPVLFLDEAFCHVAGCYRRNVALFARQLARELGVQIILVTQLEELGENADQVFYFEKAVGTCRVVERTVPA